MAAVLGWQMGSPAPLQAFGLLWVQLFALHNNLLKRSLYTYGSLNQLPIAYLKGFKNTYCFREIEG